jgi:uncharacterized protein
MLSFPTQSIAAGAIQVQDDLDRDDQCWIEGDSRPQDALRVTGRLSSAGEGRFYFSGKFAGKATVECRRCLQDVDVEVGSDAHLLFADADTDTEGDPDIYPLAVGRTGESVDLRPAIREQWLLEVPAFVLCSPDCKGLCTTCGANLNQGACSCAPKANE